MSEIITDLDKELNNEAVNEREEKIMYHLGELAQLISEESWSFDSLIYQIHENIGKNNLWKLSE